MATPLRDHRAGLPAGDGRPAGGRLQTARGDGLRNGKAEAKQYAAASQALDRLDGMLAKLPAARTGDNQVGRQTPSW
jgi:hypothetical protein